LHLPYFQVSQEYGLVRSLEEISVYSADIADYFLTSPDNLIYGKFVETIQVNRNWGEHSLFPGLCVLILACYGLFIFKNIKLDDTNKFGFIYIASNIQNIYIFLLFVSIILSFGYPLHFFGHIIDINLPYKFLYEYIPGFKSMRVPSRFGIIVMLSLSILAAYGLKRLTNSRSRNTKYIVLSMVTLLIIIENLYIPVNLYLMPVNQEIPSVYRWLANETEPFSIVEIPIGSFWDVQTPIEYNTIYMYYSTYHWKYLINGYSGFFPTPYIDMLWVLRSFPSAESIALLQNIGTKYVIVHMDCIDLKDSDHIKENIFHNYSDSLHLVNILDRSYVYKVDKSNITNDHHLILPFKGLYDIESWSGAPTRWMQSDATLAVFSYDNRTTNLTLRALSFHRPRTLEIYAGEEMVMRVSVPSTEFKNVTVYIPLVNGTNTVRLHVPEGCERPCDIKEINNPDTRSLSIAVQNMTIG